MFIPKRHLEAVAQVEIVTSQPHCGHVRQRCDVIRVLPAGANFGQILQGGTWTGEWGYDEALALARGARGEDRHGYRAELIHLIELAQSLSSGS